ncbi:hypothetical protein A2160_03625 [Candidatus Beckwithbacteria bacterium RBG_13_42_9]|uniref:ZIP family metal transporter n=1 Tax=Candidatus Beckwithbacteria bacterium RBG_13_42_9 TaxID=1797457 RepID=A0A1F5E8J4_9BACT|nr:MAG: hypothetical protein A2160_03625 [Candidatus Beckwithbacteria bacterium RBG_13_42_9]
MNHLILGFLATLIVSLISLIGIFALVFSPLKIKNFTFWLVSFSVGALFGDVFFHLLPELAKTSLTKIEGAYILIGVLLFFVLEKFIAWRHCHVPTSENHPHPLALMNLIGDGLHNFLDGAIIGGSFLISTSLGLATTIAVIFHEIPQEFGNFGVLIHGGFSVFKALLFNFFSALTAIMGFFFVVIFAKSDDYLTSILIPLTIGGFLYVAGSDLVPELKKTSRLLHSMVQMSGIILGSLVMYGLTLLD